MSLKFYRLDVNIQINSCCIQRNSNADATVLPAKPKEKEPALSVCKLFSLCRSGCSALGFSFSRSGSDSAVPAPQTVHRPQAQSRETPSFPSRFRAVNRKRTVDAFCIQHPQAHPELMIRFCQQFMSHSAHLLHNGKRFFRVQVTDIV